MEIYDTMVDYKDIVLTRKGADIFRFALATDDLSSC